MPKRFFTIDTPNFLQVPFQLSFLLSSVTALFLLVFFFRIQPIVPIFYSLADPADFLASKIWLLIFPVLAFTISFGHLFLIKMLYQHQKIIPTLFAWSTVAVQVLILLELLRIIYIIS